MVSSLIFIALVLLLFQSVESAFNRIWRVEHGRTWARRISALALFLIVGAVAVAALVELATRAAQVAEGFEGGTLAAVGLELVGLAIAWVVFTLANKVLPNAQVRWVPAIAGGVIVGTIWHVAKSVFTWYVQDVAGYDNIYGAIGTIPAFFLWVWLSLLLLLIGGHIAFVIQNLRPLVLTESTRGEELPDAFYGVAVMATLARAFRGGEAPITAVKLAERLRVAPYFVTQALGKLVAGELVLKMPCKGEQTYTLARPGETVPILEIVDHMSGVDFIVPPVEHASPLHARIHQLFEEARACESSLLGRIPITALEADAPPPASIHS